ncbi:hypothetical protein RJ641_007002 [Dillenia turbinata]|uniref:Uncharacterized protein n=1 Tax=Dillenia turbinata TaxID=194707 RepID=A0AAN8Z833_9MAGN
MSTIEMASVAPKFTYQRLRNEGMFDDLDEERFRVIGRSRIWSRLRKLSSRKKLRIRIPSLRRFLRRRAKVVSAVRVSFCRILKRLKDGRAHFADLFAGNYLFLQVTPTPLKFIEKSHVGHNNFNSLASRYALGENC